jgi:hypothetical protein
MARTEVGSKVFGTSLNMTLAIPLGNVTERDSLTKARPELYMTISAPLTAYAAVAQRRNTRVMRKENIRDLGRFILPPEDNASFTRRVLTTKLHNRLHP